jgi:hypothetical protein
MHACPAAAVPAARNRSACDIHSGAQPVPPPWALAHTYATGALTLGQPCSSGSVCGEHAACVNGGCSCEAGYNYDPASGTCEASKTCQVSSHTSKQGYMKAAIH